MAGLAVTNKVGREVRGGMTMYSRSMNRLVGIAGVIAKVSRSCGMLEKTEATPPRALDTEANVSSPSAFEAWLTTYLKQLDECRKGPSLVDRGASSFFFQNAEPEKEM
jgi:hypothetical protein